MRAVSSKSQRLLATGTPVIPSVDYFFQQLDVNQNHQTCEACYVLAGKYFGLILPPVWDSDAVRASAGEEAAAAYH